MIKYLCFLSLVVLATAAVAHHILAIGSNGAGSATAHDGRVGSFHYSVTKRIVKGHHDQLRGSLRFEQLQNAHGASLLIEMGTPSAVAVSDNVCEFSGAATLTRLVKGHHQVQHGHISVRVADRRSAHHPHNDPDTFRIQFTNKHTTYAFDGLVDHGDLVVFSRQEH